MATALLNSEPSLPAERQHQHLPPKSYADAAEENLDTLPRHDQESQESQELYAGKGEDEAPRTPRRNMHKKSGSMRVNGHTKESKGPNVVIERFEEKDGQHLVSIQPGWDSKKGKSLVERRNSELVSGRKAGARWEQSRYGECWEVSTNSLTM